MQKVQNHLPRMGLPRSILKIARSIGQPVHFERAESVEFPSGTCQVWEFQATDDPKKVAVAVFFANGVIARWKILDETTEQAVLRFNAQAQSRQLNAATALVA